MWAWKSFDVTFVTPLGDRPSVLQLSQALISCVCQPQASVISALTPDEEEKLPSELEVWISRQNLGQGFVRAQLT